MWEEGPRDPALAADGLDVWFASYRPEDLLEAGLPDAEVADRADWAHGENAAAELAPASTRVARAAALPSAEAFDTPPTGLRGLTVDDVLRSRRFRFQRDRTRWIHARLVVRDILSRYLNVAPEDLHFAVDPSGKPRLPADRHPGGFHFNLSHAGDYTLVAVCRDAEIGADVEWIHRTTNIDSIARRFFSPAEQRQLGAVPEDGRRQAFFECWTLKEAFLKAKGTGLRLPLTGFDVAFGPGVAPRVLATRWDAADAARWSLFGLQPESGVVGAVAVEGRRPALRTARWAKR